MVLGKGKLGGTCIHIFLADRRNNVSRLQFGSDRSFLCGFIEVAFLVEEVSKGLTPL